MKKHLQTLTLLIAISFSTKAQFTKGQKVLGGNISFFNNNNQYIGNSTDVTVTSFNISPSFGRFTNANTIKGIISNFSFSKYTQSGGTAVNNSSSIELGYFVQKQKSIGKDFFLFLQGNISGVYNWSNYQFASMPNLTKTNGYGARFAIYPGVGYKINKHFLADISLSSVLGISYNHGENTYSQTTGTSNTRVEKQDQFSIYTGLKQNYLSNLSIGFRYIW